MTVSSRSISATSFSRDRATPFAVDSFVIGPDTPRDRVGHAGTILLVDDTASNRGFLFTVLQYHGYRVIEAEDGREGLAAALAEHPDLIITDVLMPIMDGYELLRQLRANPVTSAIPVVFYTAHYSDREAKSLAQSSNVSHVLTKPVNSAEVLEVVRRLLATTLVAGVSPRPAPVPDFDRKHVRLLTDKLSEKVADLVAANGRLRALIAIGIEIAAEEDSERRLQGLCDSTCALFGAEYVTIGIVDRNDHTVQRVTACGTSTSWIAAGERVSGVLGEAMNERRAVRGNNPTGEPALLGLASGHPEIHGYVAAPIASPAHTYGWICVAAAVGATFDADDEYLLQILGDQVGRIYELEHEIRERKRAEEDVRSERDRAQRFLDTAGIMLLALDLNGRVTLVNSYACALLGWTAEELRGRRWVDTCLPARSRELEGLRFDHLVHGDVGIVESTVVTRAGSERLIEWRNTLLLDAAGAVTGTFSSGADITDKHQAVEALRAGEERMRFALENADVGIWDMDFTTGTLRWSEIVASHYGVAPGTFEGTFKGFIERVHPDDRDALVHTIEETTKVGADFTVPHRAVWPDGTVRWLTTAGRVLLGPDGQAVRGIGISLDITDRRKLEAQYQQAQKMEAIGTLAGGVAHDFNNLLTVILGNCELALAGVDSADPTRWELTEIQRAALSAAGLTRQLLAFSRKQVIEPTLLDIKQIVASMETMLRRLIPEDVTITLSLSSESPIVLADRGQLEQIVMNLAVNARDAMPSGGRLAIDVSRVDLDADDAAARGPMKSGRYAVLTVRDTGTGMTPEVQARVFEPFFTTKEVGRGTGLGLATVHGIATSAGGGVSLYSEVGMGTTFKVYLPETTLREAVVHATSPSHVRKINAAATILLVEDNKGLLELTRKMLEKQGYAVRVAGNATEALEQFSQPGQIDLILTDVVMPGLSGPELTRQLLDRNAALKIVFMSGYAAESIAVHGGLRPGTVFLDKPFTSAQLARKVREALDT